MRSGVGEEDMESPNQGRGDGDVDEEAGDFWEEGLGGHVEDGDKIINHRIINNQTNTKIKK